MTSLFKNLLGSNGPSAEELRTVLHEMQQERSRYERLVEGVRAAVERLQQLGEPIAKAGSDVDSVATRLVVLEQRFESIEHLSTRMLTLNERAEGLVEGQQRAEAQIIEILQGTDKIRSAFDEVSQKIDLANNLKDQLSSFLEIDKPFQQLRGEAEQIRAQVGGTGDHVARVREQSDRLLDAHKLAMSKMEALDRRRDELSRDLQDKERRITRVEESARAIDGIQNAVNDARREMATLKASADLVSQKTATLEAQREAVDRALAQAENLDRAMRQIDAGVRQQHENEKTLGQLQEKLAAVRAIHETVEERSGEISQLQREIDERTHAARQDLAAATDETKKTIERFDFERRGLESVTQRVADLRAALSDCENRFKGLSDSRVAVRELDTRTQALAAQMQTLAAEAATVEQEMSKLTAIRRDLDQTGQAAREVGTQVAQIAQASPTLEAALRDLGQLNGDHAKVKDALEQTQLAHTEMTRVRESQSETRSWLAGVEQTVNAMRKQVGELRSMAPTIEFVQNQTQRIGESLSSIEARREMVEQLDRRMADLGALGSQLDERGAQLKTRMEAAEHRFVGLEKHSEEAERMTMTVASVSSGLNDARREAGEIKKTLAEIEEKSESVEELAGRTREMKQELEQRKHALAEAAKDLQRASTLREEAAASAQQLDELAQQLTSSLSAADKRVTRVDELSRQLENRASGLKSVEKRFNEFEGRLASWGEVDQEVSRSLKQITARQDIVATLKADLDRMFTMADQTSAHVREITSAHQEIEGSRELLNEIAGKLEEVRGTASTLDERKRQMNKAEQRLARADGLLVDVRSSLEALEGQKAIVDQAVEKAGSLQFLLKQAEAAIEGLREERKTTARVRSAVAGARKDHKDHDEDEDEGENLAKAA